MVKKVSKFWKKVCPDFRQVHFWNIQFSDTYCTYFVQPTCQAYTDEVSQYTAYTHPGNVVDTSHHDGCQLGPEVPDID